MGPEIEPGEEHGRNNGDPEPDIRDETEQEGEKTPEYRIFHPEKRENNCRSDTHGKVHLSPDNKVINVFLCEHDEPVQVAGPEFPMMILQLLRESLCFKEEEEGGEKDQDQGTCNTPRDCRIRLPISAEKDWIMFWNVRDAGSIPIEMRNGLTSSRLLSNFSR